MTGYNNVAFWCPVVEKITKICLPIHWPSIVNGAAIATAGYICHFIFISFRVLFPPKSDFEVITGNAGMREANETDRDYSRSKPIDHDDEFVLVCACVRGGEKPNKLNCLFHELKAKNETSFSKKKLTALAAFSRLHEKMIRVI